MVNKENSLKQWLMPVIKLVIAAGLIYWLIQSGRFDIHSLKKIGDPKVWLGGVLIFLGVLLLNSKRWQILLHYEAVDLSYFQAVRLSLVGIFFNFFMPGGLGGDVVKAGYLMRDYKDKKFFIGWSILVDRILGLIALLIISGVTGLMFYHKLPDKLQTSFYTLSLLIIVGFLVAVCVLVFSPKKAIDRVLRSHHVAERVLHPLFFFFQRPKRIIVPFLMSFLSQGLVISLGVYLLFFLGLELPVWKVLLVFPFGFMATVLPISPAGVGVGQAAFFYLFEQVANNGEFGVLVITFFQAVQFLVGILGGLTFVMYKKGEAN